jgi:hypothetical protein
MGEFFLELIAAVVKSAPCNPFFVPSVRTQAAAKSLLNLGFSPPPQGGAESP